MQQIHARFVGVELYFDNLERAKRFYLETLGLKISDEQVGHHAKLDSGAGFVCLERKGAESYPSRDKAVLFFEVPNLASALERSARNSWFSPNRDGPFFTTPKATMSSFLRAR
jgi:predicted enzyme related to lactoylglutathione lyase